jgi:two-component system CheB/CheR fusion protein
MCSVFHKMKMKTISPVREGIDLRSGNHMHPAQLDVMANVPMGTAERPFLINSQEGRAYRAKPTAAIVTLQPQRRDAPKFLQTIIDKQKTVTADLGAATYGVPSRNEQPPSSRRGWEAPQSFRSHGRECFNEDLRNFSEGLQIPVLILDNNLRIRRFTRLAENLFNLTPAEVGRPIHHLRPNLDLPSLQPIVSRAIAARTPQEQEVQDREGHRYAMNVRPYVASNHTIDGVLITLVDNDSMKQSLKEAERACDYAEAIVDTVRQPLVVLHPGLRVVTANRAFYESFQVSREEVEHRAIFDVLGGWDSPGLHELLENILPENGRLRDFTLTHTFPRIGMRTLSLHARRLLCEGDMSSLILLAIEDVTDRQSITAELMDNRERLRDLTAGLLTAQEEEGRRISRELHDDLDQRVAMLIVEMEVLEKGPPTSAKSMRGRLTSLRTQTESISDDLRNTAHRLHPSMVDHLGLPAALRSLCADFSKNEKLQVHFRQRNISGVVPAAIALCLYRVAQEALRNVAKHSSGNHATVSLYTGKARILLSISNSGRGFDLAMIKAKRGLGIVSMEERVRLLAGTLAIRSRPLSGTRVVVEIPLAKDKS